MDTARWQMLKRIFERAIRLEKGKRKSFLEEACKEDPALKERVEALLAADEEVSSCDFMEPKSIGEASVDEETEALIGTRIGQYRIQGLISSGGMGDVYEAEQETPRRTVAVKVLKRSITSKSALKRFEYESHILARLRHPNIAQVFEAGRHRMSGDGGGELPYFVMEYIEGARPITRYTREKNLSIRERVLLFLQVCRAVQHGNQKGIIHRDLKPGNILVDRSGQAKVIDFGVARVTDSDLQLTSLHTEMGQIIGTLQYMSPEQCHADSHSLDVRCDVYSLGVVLYETLLEQLPYDVRKTSVIEAARRIREEPPKRPSTVSRTLRGDLETIVLTALEKDPDRRYHSVGSLADDLQRFMKGELILAKPAGPITRIVKTVKRKPVTTVGVGVGLLSLLVFLLYIVLWSYPRILREQALTDEALKAASDRAQEKAEINLFLEKMLSAPHPFKAGRDVKVVEVLDKAAEDIAGAFPDQPGVEASLRSTIGWSYLKLGIFDEAETHLRAAVRIQEEISGPGSVETLMLKNRLAAVLKDRDKLEEAENLVREAFEGLRSLLGADHRDTLLAMVNLGKTLHFMDRLEEAKTILTEALGLYRSVVGDDHTFTLDTLSQLAATKKKMGELAEADELLSEAYERQRVRLGSRHPITLNSMGNLALLKSDLGDYVRAEALFREAIEVRREVQGEDHPYTLALMHNLAIPLFRLGKLSETEEIQQELLRIRRSTLGSRHRETISTMMNLANTVMNLGRYDEAESLFRESLGILESQRLQKPQLYVSGCINLGILLSRQGRLSEAESLLGKVLEEYEDRFGKKHKHILYTKHSLASVLHRQGRSSEAEALNREVLQVRRAVLGEEHLDTLKTMNNLGTNYLDQGKLEEAEALFRAMYETVRAKFGEEHYDTLTALSNMALVQNKRRNFEEAEAKYREVIRLRAATLGEDHPDTMDSMKSLAVLLRRTGRLGEAESMLRGILEAGLDKLGSNHRLIADVRFQLGFILEYKGNYSEAEALYAKALETYRARLGAEHGDTLSVMNRLARLLAEQDRVSEAQSLFEEAVGFAEKSLSREDELRGRIHRNFGICLTMTEDFKEAESHLKEGYEILLAACEDDGELRVALEGLINLYEAWGNADEAAAWRAKLEL